MHTSKTSSSGAIDAHGGDAQNDCARSGRGGSRASRSDMAALAPRAAAASQGQHRAAALMPAARRRALPRSEQTDDGVPGARGGGAGATVHCAAAPLGTNATTCCPRVADSVGRRAHSRRGVTRAAARDGGGGGAGRRALRRGASARARADDGAGAAAAAAKTARRPRRWTQRRRWRRARRRPVGADTAHRPRRRRRRRRRRDR